jgi:glycerate kinase
MSLKILVAPSGFKESLGAEEVADYIEIGIKRVYPDAVVRKAPLVDGGEGFTKALVQATGGIDFQTPRGKIPAEVASRAKRYGLPVIALAGTVGKGAKINYDHGIDSFLSILDKPCSLSEAIENAPSLLKHAAERTMRFLMIGQQIKALGI